MNNRSDYIWGRHTSGLLYIADLDKGGKSVTNDIENVLIDIRYGQQKINLRGQGIIYRDPMGEWARVLHVDGRFKAFACIEPHSLTAKYRNEIEEELIQSGDVQPKRK